MEQTETPGLFDLHLDQSSINYLSETARWTKFLSIMGFICCGLMVLFGLFFGTIMSVMGPAMGSSESVTVSAMGNGFVGVLLVIASLLLFFPALYLYNFSTKIRRALNNNDQPGLTDSLKNLKSFFKFYGIYVIVVLSLYVLMFIFGIIGALVGHRG